MKKRVIVLSSSLEVGGIERGLIGLLENLDLNKYEVDLFLWSHSGEWMASIPKGVNLLPEQTILAAFNTKITDLIKMKKLGFALIKLTCKTFGTVYAFAKGKTNNVGYYYNLSYKRLSSKFIKISNREYDCLISFRPDHTIGAYCFSAKKKVAFIRVDYSAEYIDTKMEYKVWERYNHIAAVSQSALEQFCLKMPALAARGMVIENITSVSKIREDAQADVTDEMPKEADMIKLCTVARLSQAKGIDNAVLICKRLLDYGLKVKWYIVGYGPDEEKIKKMIIDHNLENNFLLLGKKGNPYPYMAACDVYVQPSRSEGKANAVKEAQILCKPVAITNYSTAASQLKDRIDGVILSYELDQFARDLYEFLLDIDLQKNIIDYCKSIDFNKNNDIYKIEKIIDGS